MANDDKQTQVFTVDPQQPDDAVLARPAAILAAGGLVAFPTETVYGLGANGLDAAATAAIFRAKGRPADNPLILHIASLPELAALVTEVTPAAAALTRRYWPGPLTVVLPRRPQVPDIVTGGLDTVAVRMPDHPVARALIRLARVPVAAPSANISGRPSPTDAAGVLTDMRGRIDAVVDGGPCRIGVESTVVDCTTPVPTILRPGGITPEMLHATLGEVAVDPAVVKGNAKRPRAPGMKYRHYAPAAPLVLVEGDGGEETLLRLVRQALAEGRRVGAVVSEETARRLPAAVEVQAYGPRGQAAPAAAHLYRCLLHFDRHPVDIIYGEGLDDKGLGFAVMNRMRKAAGFQIVRAGQA